MTPFALSFEIGEEVEFRSLAVKKSEFTVDQLLLTAAAYQFCAVEYRLVILLLELGCRILIDIESQILASSVPVGLGIAYSRIKIQIDRKSSLSSFSPCAHLLMGRCSFSLFITFWLLFDFEIAAKLIENQAVHHCGAAQLCLCTGYY